MAEDKTEREKVNDTILTKLQNLVKSWWFPRLCYAISGEEEDEFSSEITNLIAQVEQDKAAYPRTEIIAIKDNATNFSSEGRSLKNVMKRVNEYLSNSCSWADVQTTIAENKDYNKTKPCRAEEIVLDVAKIDVSSTALAINNKLIEQIEAYLAKYPGIENPKTKVMTAIKKYLEGTDPLFQQWADVQTVINMNPGHSDKRWGFYSQVGSTIKQVKDYKVKLGEIREDIPSPEVPDIIDATNTEALKDRVNTYIDSNKKTYQKLDNKYITQPTRGAKPLYASLNPDEKFNLIESIKSAADRQTYQKREVVTAVQHYLAGELSWPGVCVLMKKYPQWNEASRESKLETIINDIKANRPNETARATEVFTLMNSIKSKMQAIIDDSPSTQAQGLAKSILKAIESKLWYSTAYPPPKAGLNELTSQALNTPQQIKERVEALVKLIPSLNTDSIIKTLTAFDEIAECSPEKIRGIQYC